MGGNGIVLCMVQKIAAVAKVHCTQLSPAHDLPFLYPMLPICTVCVHTAGSTWRGVVPVFDSIYLHCLRSHCGVRLARCHS
jgi:hypothetical protein